MIAGTWNRPVLGLLPWRAVGGESESLNTPLIKAPVCSQVARDTPMLICENNCCDDVLLTDCSDGWMKAPGLLAQILQDDPTLHEDSSYPPSMPSAALECDPRDAPEEGPVLVDVASPRPLLVENDPPVGRARAPSLERPPALQAVLDYMGRRRVTFLLMLRLGCCRRPCSPRMTLRLRITSTRLLPCRSCSSNTTTPGLWRTVDWLPLDHRTRLRLARRRGTVRGLAGLY